MIVEGMPYFAFPQYMKRIIEAVLLMDEKYLRYLGFLIMLVGLGIIYWGMRQT